MSYSNPHNTEERDLRCPVQKEKDAEANYTNTTTLFMDSHTVSDSTYSNTAAFSQANLEATEKLFREFVDENGYPLRTGDQITGGMKRATTAQGVLGMAQQIIKSRLEEEEREREYQRARHCAMYGYPPLRTC